ncbi:pentatricopeptide repeat-containing protein At2g13600-like isoform X2 [Diospyros lotus]|uniref:pentatricopeptide repeat-containing protein At2g13600-like isoform X2 n=1 Tax=Diospyros lotus TaxID=55363 RepID=UPI002254B1A9|nr:pentatricopeptide repeat-containing protein At2g13600-like isoform X2 [Diospyros lotus]
MQILKKAHCIRTRNLRLGKILHSYLIKTALALDVFLANRLVDMYSKCESLGCAQKAFDDLPTKNTHSWNTIISAYSQMGRFDRAHHLFDEMPEPNLVSYNSLISSLSHHGFYKESIAVFRRLQNEYNGVVMDEFTVVSAVGSCACLGALQLLRQVHGVALVIGVRFNVAVYNALIDAYGKCGIPDNSFFIFSQMVERDVVSWTCMLVAYARASRLADACRVFDQMPVKSTVTWTALIAGFAQNGHPDEALDLFSQMQEESIQPNAFTYVSVLSACADVAFLDRGKQLHGFIIRSNSGGDKFNLYLFNALIDMYCKCGDMKSAWTLFKGMPRKDIVSWNSLITGFAQNKNGRESLVLFKKMVEAGIKPNHVTFLGVLSACSHAGLVDEGLQVLESMERYYTISPRSDHYTMLIDLLGRKNRLEEATELIERAPKGLNQVGMWGALLSACQIHGNLDLACRAGATLLELEPKNAGRHVMLSNIYVAAGKWDDARKVRVLMETKGLTKEAGNSWIEVRSTRHHFVTKDRFHYRIGEIYELLHKLADQMKGAGYLHDIVFSPEDVVIS